MVVAYCYRSFRAPESGAVVKFSLARRAPALQGHAPGAALLSLAVSTACTVSWPLWFGLQQEASDRILEPRVCFAHSDLSLLKLGRLVSLLTSLVFCGVRT